MAPALGLGLGLQFHTASGGAAAVFGVLARSSNASPTVNASSFAVTLPTITAGRVLLSIVSAAAAATLSTASSGWLLLTQATSGGVTQAIFYKKGASGGDTLSIDSTVSTQYSAISYCIEAGPYPAIYAGAPATGSSANSDPPASNILKSRSALWIAARSGAGATVATAAPSGFGSLRTQAAGGASGASTNTAELSVAAASQDPGAFTSATADWVTSTIAIWADVAPLATWQTARDSLARNPRAVLVGDSITAGWIATNTTSTAWATNDFASNIAANLAASFHALPGRSSALIGDGGAGFAGVSLPSYDSRFAWDADWGGSQGDGTSSIFTTAGGGMPRTFGSGTLTFTPGVAFDRAKVIICVYESSPQFTVNVDGGASLGTLAMAGTNTVAAQTFNVTDATHALKVVGVSSALGGYIVGFETWRSTVREASFISAGWWGATAANWLIDGPANQPLSTLRFLAADLYVLCLGANDHFVGVAPATFLAQMRQIVLNLQISGSVLAWAVNYFEPAYSGFSEASQKAYSDLVGQVAAELNCAYVDMKSQPGWTDYATTLANGYLSTDKLHPSALGYAGIAAALRPVIDTP